MATANGGKQMNNFVWGLRWKSKVTGAGRDCALLLPTTEPLRATRIAIFIYLVPAPSPSDTLDH